MVNPIKDIAGMIGSKINRMNVERKATGALMDKIGPGSILGEKNYNTYYKRISDKVKAGKIPEANKYAIQEGQKVANQKGPARTFKRQ